MDRAAPDSKLCPSPNKYLYMTVISSCHYIPCETRTHTFQHRAQGHASLRLGAYNFPFATTTSWSIHSGTLYHPEWYHVPTRHCRSLRRCRTFVCFKQTVTRFETFILYFWTEEIRTYQEAYFQRDDHWAERRSTDAVAERTLRRIGCSSRCHHPFERELSRSRHIRVAQPEQSLSCHSGPGDCDPGTCTRAPGPGHC